MSIHQENKIQSQNHRIHERTPVRLIVCYYIYHSIMNNHGPSVFLHRKLASISAKEKLTISSPKKCSVELNLNHVSVKQSYLFFAKQGVIKNLNEGHPTPYYVLIRGKKFRKLLLEMILKSINSSAYYRMPKHLRDMPLEKRYKRISEIHKEYLIEFDDYEAADYLLHSAFEFPRDENQVFYKKSQVYRLNEIIQMSANEQFLQFLIKKLRIVKVNIRKQIAHSFTDFDEPHTSKWPNDIQNVDLYFVTSKKFHRFLKIVNRWLFDLTPSDEISGISPILNEMLLKSYPIRGVESAERIFELLHHNRSANSK